MRNKSKFVALAIVVSGVVAIALLTGCATLTPQISYDFGRQRLDVSFIGLK